MLREKESRALKKFSDLSYTLDTLQIKYIYLELQHMMRNAALLLLLPRTTFFRCILFMPVWNLFIPHSWLLTEFSSMIKECFGKSWKRHKNLGMEEKIEGKEKVLISLLHHQLLLKKHSRVYPTFISTMITVELSKEEQEWEYCSFYSISTPKFKC